MQQVFWNLLANAVKFTPRGGRVDVGMQVEGAQVRISVSDTGSGIAPTFLPHVFERFRQADGSSTREHGGLGLGLSIVRHLVELHGGRMKAHSAGIGQGATFTVCLPYRPAEQHVAVPRRIERRARGRTLDLAGAHILIVDDETDARDLMRAMLANTGARISEAGSAAEALRLFAEDRPDIMLGDIAMPAEDGYSLMRTLRALPDGEGTQVRAIAISAYARREDRQRALKAGFNDHVCKPVHADELFDALERVWLQSAPSIGPGKGGRLAPEDPDSTVH
jgi:CheY-like chemotaxis protein